MQKKGNDLKELEGKTTQFVTKDKELIEEITLILSQKIGQKVEKLNKVSDLLRQYKLIF